MQLSILLSVGLVLAWVGERIVESTTARGVLTGLGVLAVVAATGLRFVKARGAAPSLARLHRTLAALHGLAFLALGFYALQSDLWTRVADQALSATSPVLAGVLGVAWPVLLAASLLPTLLLEMSYAAMAKAPALEEGRLREAMFSGLGLASALVFAFSAQYVATARDAKSDFSYFRMARPGEATKKLVASLDEPVEVFLFFPPASDSGELVEQFFTELAAESPKLKVTRLDHALEPLKAKELGVSGNGAVLLKKGARKETVFVGVEVEKSRTQLRGLDAEVQKRLLQVAKARRTVYLTAGHGERTQDPANSADQRATIDILWKTLQDQNFDVRWLTTAEGLGQEVPQDAAAVFVLGPTRAFTAPEAVTLEAYGKRGGRLFIALDPEAGLAFDELLAPLGLTMKAQPLAQERGVANVKPPPGKADRVNIGTRTISSHPSVSSLGRSNAPVLFLGAGGLEDRTPRPADLVVDYAVRSMPEAWNDANGNFEFDLGQGETKKAWGVVAAVTRRAPSAQQKDELRALVLADSDAVSDVVLQQLPGNQYLVVDGFRWLLGDEQLAGVTNTEQDVPLARTKGLDAAWFYGTTFLGPALVVGVGFLARRRTRKPSTQEATP